MHISGHRTWSININKYKYEVVWEAKNIVFTILKLKQRLHAVKYVSPTLRNPYIMFRTVVFLCHRKCFKRANHVTADCLSILAVCLNSD